MLWSLPESHTTVAVLTAAIAKFSEIFQPHSWRPNISSTLPLAITLVCQLPVHHPSPQFPGLVHFCNSVATVCQVSLAYVFPLSKSGCTSPKVWYSRGWIGRLKALCMSTTSSLRGRFRAFYMSKDGLRRKTESGVISSLIIVWRREKHG